MIIGPKSSSALRAIPGRNVSSESGTSGISSLIAASAGSNRAHSSSSQGGVLPGRVEHPPISNMSAPSETALRAHSVTRSGSASREEA